MLHQQDAVAAVQAKLQAFEPLPEGDRWVVYPEYTREHSFGWVIFYGSHLFRATGERQYAVAGNAPFLVNRYTGAVVPSGTAQPIEYYIAEYKAGLERAGT